MKVREVIKNAERWTIAHDYKDGTFLFDIYIGKLAYSIRVSMETFTEARK